MLETPSSESRFSDNASEIAFIDVEASGLGKDSWPVEIGWAFATGEPRSVMIKPADDWSMTAWEKTAEKRHGNSPSNLVTQGKQPIDTALVLNAALGGARVFSHTPDYDSMWLFRLYDAAGVKPNYRLYDLGDLISPLWSGDQAALSKQAEGIPAHAQRAASEVHHLQKMYEIALASSR